MTPPNPVSGISQFKLVNGYLKVNLRLQKLQAKLKKKEEKLEPLRGKIEVLTNQAIIKWNRLNGTQQSEANKILARLHQEKAHVRRKK